jgi:hypothetical protein
VREEKENEDAFSRHILIIPSLLWCNGKVRIKVTALFLNAGNVKGKRRNTGTKAINPFLGAHLARTFS